MTRPNQTGSDLPAIGAFWKRPSGSCGNWTKAPLKRPGRMLLRCHERRGQRLYLPATAAPPRPPQHFACDLARIRDPARSFRPFDVRCLTDNVSLYTAWANDGARDRGLFQSTSRPAHRRRLAVGDFRSRRNRVFPPDLVHAVRHAPPRWGRRPSLWWVLMAEFFIVRRLAPFWFRSNPLHQTEAIHLVIEHLLMSLIKNATGRELIPWPCDIPLCPGHHASYDLSLCLPEFPLENSKKRWVARRRPRTGCSRRGAARPRTPRICSVFGSLAGFAPD